MPRESTEEKIKQILKWDVWKHPLQIKDELAIQEIDAPLGRIYAILDILEKRRLVEKRARDLIDQDLANQDDATGYEFRLARSK